MKSTLFTPDVVIVTWARGGAAALAALSAREAGAAVALVMKESSRVGGAGKKP